MADDDVLDWFFDGLARLDLMDDPSLVTALTDAFPEGAEYGWLLYWYSRFDVPIEKLPLLGLGLFGHTQGWNAVYLPPNIERSLMAEAVIEAADVSALVQILDLEAMN
jgi:hypothetical protein